MDTHVAYDPNTHWDRGLPAAAAGRWTLCGKPLSREGVVTVEADASCAGCNLILAQGGTS